MPLPALREGPAVSQICWTCASACEVCGLDLREHDAGDGAAVGVILVLGAVVVGLAFWVEFHFSPPLWVHAVLWPVVTLPLAIADDAADEGGAGRVAVPASGFRDGAVSVRECVGGCHPSAKPWCS